MEERMNLLALGRIRGGRDNGRPSEDDLAKGRLGEQGVPGKPPKPRYLRMTSSRTPSRSTWGDAQHGRRIVWSHPLGERDRNNAFVRVGARDALSTQLQIDQARGALKVAIISGGPGTTGMSIAPPASAQNSLQ